MRYQKANSLLSEISLKTMHLSCRMLHSRSSGTMPRQRCTHSSSTTEMAEIWETPGKVWKSWTLGMEDHDTLGTQGLRSHRS